MKCTVLVPSYNRLPQLVELLGRLRRQSHSDFEILVIEQSTQRDAAALTELERLVRDDPRIRVERHQFRRRTCTVLLRLSRSPRRPPSRPARAPTLRPE